MKVIEFDTTVELVDALKSNDYRVSKCLLKEVYKNKDQNKKINILSLYAKDADSYVDLTLAPEDYIECLESNLKIMEQHDDFDECQNIIEVLEYLRS